MDQPAAKSMSVRKRITFSLLGVVGVIAVISGLKDIKTSQPKPYDPIHGRLQLSPTSAFYLTNQDTSAWHDCVAIINPHAADAGFTMQVGDVEPGSRLELGLKMFADRNGAHFDPQTQKVLEADVHCGTVAGSWNFSK